MTTKNVRFQGLVKTTAEIESDKFAGRIGWNTTLARFVAYYNSTQYAQMARRDVLETFAAGMQDSTLGVGLPMFAGTAGRLSTESVANFRSRIGAVNKAGDTMTGGLTLTTGDLNVGVGAIKTAGVTRISNGGAGTLTTLSTTGMATFTQATVSDLTADQIVTAGTGGRLQGDSGLIRVATSGVTRKILIGDGLVAGAVGVQLNGQANQAIAIEHQIAGISTWLSGIAVASSPHYRIANYSGASLVDYPLVVVDGAGGDVIIGGLAATKRDVILTKNLNVTGQAGTGNRLVQAGADGTQSASIPVPTAYIQTLFDDADAAAARATLGAGTSNLALGEASSTAYRGDRGKAAYDHSQLTASNPHGTTAAQVGAVNKSGDEMNVDAGLRIQSSGGPTSGFISKSTTGDLREVQLANGLLIFRNPSFAGSLPFASLEPDGRVLFNHPGGGYWEFGGGDLNMSLGRQLRAYGVPVVGTRKTGWTAPTGTATRSTFATGSVTLPQLAERVKALIDDLISHGLIGA